MRPHFFGSALLILASGLTVSCSRAPALLDEEASSAARERPGPLLRVDDPVWNEPAPDTFRIEITTDLGPFQVELYRDWAPHGVDRLYQLVRHGFYDDSRFFRVRDGYIVQFGIAGDPAIARAWREQTIPDDPVVGSNTYGTLGFAMTGPDTRTTQLYINLTDNSHLDADGFAPIGRVTVGMEGVVQRLHAGHGERAGGGMRGGRQGRIFAEGNLHLDEDFPSLSRLTAARVLTD